MNKLASALKNIVFKDPYKWNFWLIIAFAVRLVVFLTELNTNKFSHGITGVWGVADNDTYGYLGSIDNLIQKGTYTPDLRMPGYGVFYLPLALVFPKVVACNILILVQFLLSAISTYLLPLIALQLFKKRVFFYATFYLYVTNIYSVSDDIFLLTESLTTSLLIGAVFCFVTYFKNYNKKRLVMAGVLLTGVIFMRPVFAVLLVFLLAILLVNLIKNKRALILPVVLFTSFFVLCDGSWIIRNYKHYKRIIPLTKALFDIKQAEPYLRPLIDFTRSFGGSIEWWDPRTESHWLVKDDTIALDMNDTVFVLSKDTVYNGKRIPMAKGIPFANDMYTSKFNLDSLMQLRKQLLQYKSDIKLPEAKRAELIEVINNKLQVYTRSIEDEKPLSFHIKARWKLLKGFLSESSYEIPYIKFTFRIYHILCLLILGFGILGILLMSGYWIRLSVQSIVPLIPLFTIIIHPLVLRLTVGRFFVPAFPFMIICAIYAVVWLKDRFLKIAQ